MSHHIPLIISGVMSALAVVGYLLVPGFVERWMKRRDAKLETSEHAAAAATRHAERLAKAGAR